MRHATKPGSRAWRRARIGAVAVGLAVAACSDPGPATPEPPPAGPGPTFFIGDQFTATTRASQAVVDAGTIWLLDANGDFVFGVVPSANWNAQTGLSLAWAQVPGAVKYRVMARNAVTSPTAWKELTVVDAPDPLLEPTVVATGVNPWAVGLGTGGSPWSFGNHVEFAIASEGEDGVVSSSDLSDVLDSADGFPGVLTEVEIDPAGLNVPFDPGEERGATFARTIRLGFSEPMRTDTHPTLTSQSANLSVREVTAHAWGADATAPSATPSSAASHAFLKLVLTVKGACSDVLVPRSPGDVILLVRDTSFFAPGAGARLLFLDGATGALLGEAAGVAGTDASLRAVALETAIAVDLPAGSLACAISGGILPVPHLVAEAGIRVTVTDASPYFVGEQVVVYEPAGGAGPIHDLRTVDGVDSVTGELVLSDSLSPGHGTESVVVPLNGLGGEVALRPSVLLALQRDAVGGPDTELVSALPENVMVGDTVLVDADGRLETTPDQAQATVKQVRFAPAAGSPHALVLDLPASLMLFHGRAAVIGMGDSFLVGGTRDTTAAAATPLDPHGDQFSPDGRRY
jgi:hypothetical protein